MSTTELEQGSVASQVQELRRKWSVTAAELAQLLGTSLSAVARWEQGDIIPSQEQTRKIADLLSKGKGTPVTLKGNSFGAQGAFASRGSSRRSMQSAQGDLFATPNEVVLSSDPSTPILSRVKRGRFFADGEQTLLSLIEAHSRSALTPTSPMTGGTSAGKNTYTYDAHTYHTKVPPQGIVEFLRYYLPEGGLVLDPFAGSGMTGVAASVAGLDVVLNELSPAACFISHNFTEPVSPTLFARAVRAVLPPLCDLRRYLYLTNCRECGKETEILYTVWSYRVTCPYCEHEGLLWDHCRRYGNSVKEHKILTEFPCPTCEQILRKRELQRTTAEPVLLGYRCCSKAQVEHPLTKADWQRIEDVESCPPLAEGFYPTTQLPDGVNLNQPKRHGLTSVDRFYTARNLSALSHIWREIHRLEDTELASMAAFVFTSLYQRVTRLSEYRFWGGSGNMAHFNVPFIFNEANVFVTFERKAASILDHLQTTATTYRGKKVVVCGSATDLSWLPSASIDFIFTDPPFGANINYSEMNILWESWPGEYTDPAEEAIVNRAQGKTIVDYQDLMARSLSECYRVLRPGHWMLLVFMNSSGKVWEAPTAALQKAGFVAERIDIFDKQHGTFKQFVSENTAGCDLVLHCRKPTAEDAVVGRDESLPAAESIRVFLSGRGRQVPMSVFLHVDRESEPDYRMLYSEWIASGLLRGHRLMDFATFRALAVGIVEGDGRKVVDETKP